LTQVGGTISSMGRLSMDRFWIIGKLQSANTSGYFLFFSQHHFILLVGDHLFLSFFFFLIRFSATIQDFATLFLYCFVFTSLA
jgi:hypothetical protein